MSFDLRKWGLKFLFLRFFFFLWLFSPWIPVPKEDVHPLAFLTESNITHKPLPFPLLSLWFPSVVVPGWQTWWKRGCASRRFRGAEQQSYTGEWHVVAVTSVVMQKVSCARKTQGAGWERLFKELCLLENMTGRVQQGGKAQSPAAGWWWKLK